MKMMRRIGLAAVLAALAAGGTQRVRAAGADIAALTDQAMKSLVQVEYTFRNENTSREEVGQGIVLNKEGVVVISGGLIPEGMPKEWIKDVKVRLPGKQFTTVPAKFLGRTMNRLFAYVKADKPIDATPMDFGQIGETGLGQEVVAVAFYPKAGGYAPYTGISRVHAMLPLTHVLARVDTFGLTRATSPVYGMADGKLIGITFPAVGETMTINLGEGSSGTVQIKDDDQSSVFLPWEEVKAAMTDVPKEAFDSPRPWMGVDGLTGIEEEARILYGMEQPAGVVIGSVISGMPADKAGLKSKDIILAVNGAEFSQSPVPEYMVMHFQRALEKTKAGQEVKLRVLRDGKKEEVAVKMGESPKLGSEMPHVFNAKLGITTRDLVFGDTYSRKLPADQKGVMVALVKQGAPASLGSTPLRPGLLITKVNDQEVENEKQFEELVRTAAGAEEKKEVVFRVIRPDGETQVCRIDLSK